MMVSRDTSFFCFVFVCLLRLQRLLFLIGKTDMLYSVRESESYRLFLTWLFIKGTLGAMTSVFKFHPEFYNNVAAG